MKVYIENTGHIKNHENFKILFWSRESKKPIFTIFPESRVTTSPGFRFPGFPANFIVKIPEKSGKSVFWTPGTKIKF